MWSSEYEVFLFAFFINNNTNSYHQIAQTTIALQMGFALTMEVLASRVLATKGIKEMDLIAQVWGKILKITVQIFIFPQ